MTIKEFRAQLKAMGLSAQKQKDCEVLDVLHDGTELCSVTYAELSRVSSANEILAQKLRPEYIPPLG